MMQTSLPFETPPNHSAQAPLPAPTSHRSRTVVRLISVGNSWLRSQHRRGALHLLLAPLRRPATPVTTSSAARLSRAAVYITLGFVRKGKKSLVVKCEHGRGGVCEHSLDVEALPDLRVKRVMYSAGGCGGSLMLSQCVLSVMIREAMAFRVCRS